MRSKFRAITCMAIILSMLISIIPAYAAVTDTSSVDKMLALIGNQNFNNTTSISEVKNYINHFTYNSKYAALYGKQFEHPNNGKMVGTVSDGTYTISEINAKGCYAYSKFVASVIYGKNGSRKYHTEKAKKLTGNGLKNFLLSEAQAGEHLRIDNTHSVIFVSGDNNGFYYFSYNGDNYGKKILLVYKTYADFAKKYNNISSSEKSSVWLYNANTNTNTGTTISTITTEDLFLKYPQYLVKDTKTKDGLSKASKAYYAVLNSYSKGDETYAAYMNGMSDGISVTIKDIFGKLGFGETLYETWAREAATHYMQSMMENEQIVSIATSKVNSAFKKIKTAYSVNSTVDKSKIANELHQIAKENNISISPSDMDELVNGLYDDKNLGDYIKAADEAMSIWKVVVGLTEIHAIEKTTLNMLIEELEKSGQQQSDLYLGLSLLKKDIEKDVASYVLKTYGTEKAIDFLVDNIDEFIFSFASGVTVAIVKVPTKLFADYVYQDAKADKIAQATMHTSFVSSIDICLSQYRLKFMQGKGNISDIEKYEKLYHSYLASYIATLELCNDICKQKHKNSLGKDCLQQIEEIKNTYTYDNHIKWSKELALQNLNSNNTNSVNSNVTNNSNSSKPINSGATSVKISPNSYPKGNIEYGKDFKLTAKFTSDCAISEARAYMIDSNKNVIMEAKGSSTTGNYYVEGYALDKGMKFHKLNPGGYYLKYYVKDANGDTATWTSNKFYVVKNNTAASDTSDSQVEKPSTPIKFELESVPKGNLRYGESFTLKGWFRSDSAIVEARAYMLDANKNVVMEAKASSTTSNYKIQGYKLDKGMKFDELNPGAYYLKYYVKDADGDTATWMSDKFYIVKDSSNTSNDTSDSQVENPSTPIKFELESVPKGNLRYGESFTLKGWFRSDSAIVEARAYMLDANKNVIMEAKASSTTSNYKIQGYKLDKGMKFDELSPGGYYLKYFVKDADGDTATWNSDKFYIVQDNNTGNSSSGKTISDGVYVIATKLNTNYVLDISGASKDNGANLQLWKNNGSSAQTFKVTHVGNGYYQIVNTNSGKAIDVQNGDTAAGTNVWQYQINNTDAQL